MANRLMTSILVAAIVSLGFTVRAEAGYLDPGVGGMLFQLLAMVFAAITGLILLFARRIRIAIARIRRWFRERNEDPRPHEESARESVSSRG